MSGVRIKNLESASEVIGKFDEFEFVVDSPDPDSTLKLSGKDLKKVVAAVKHTHAIQEVEQLPEELGKKLDKSGGTITGNLQVKGDTLMTNLRIEKYLEVPELKYNRITATGNEFWVTDAGVVDEVSADAEGVYTVRLKEKEGEHTINFAYKDILRGIFYTQDENGNPTGFRTAYFEVTGIASPTTFTCTSLNNIAPARFMTLARQGNKSNTARQGSVYMDGLHKYIRVIDGVKDGTIDLKNIKVQLGDLSEINHPIFGQLKGYGALLENAYVCGRLVQKHPATGEEWAVGAVSVQGEQVIRYNAAGTPENASVTLTATEHGIASTPTDRRWQYKSGVDWVDISSANGLTYTLTHNAAIWNGRNTLTLRYVAFDLYDDTITITKIGDGRPGQDGTDGKDGAPGQKGDTGSTGRDLKRNYALSTSIPRTFAYSFTAFRLSDLLSEEQVTISFLIANGQNAGAGVGWGTASGWCGSYFWLPDQTNGTKSCTVAKSAQYDHLWIYFNPTSTISEFMVNKGGERSDWSPAPEDIQNAIYSAQTTANEANAKLASWMSDAVISPLEKTALRQLHQKAVADKSIIDSQAARYSLTGHSTYQNFVSAASSAFASYAKYTAASPENIAVGSDYGNIAAFNNHIASMWSLIDSTSKGYVDGLLESAKYTTIDARSLDQNTYYPVLIQVDQQLSATIKMYNSLGNSGNPHWANHGAGFTCECEWNTIGYGWGTRPVVRRIIRSMYSWSSVVPFGSIGQLGNVSQEFIFVRGGGIYYFKTTNVGEIFLATSNYTNWAGESIGTATSVTFPVTDTDSLSARVSEAAKVVTFRGEFSPYTPYYNTTNRKDCVRYGGNYYLYKGPNATSSWWNDSYWESFGGQYESLATGIFLAELAYIENLGVKNLRTNTSGQRVEITQNNNALAFYDGVQSYPVVEIKTTSDGIFLGQGSGILVRHPQSDITINNGILQRSSEGSGVSVPVLPWSQPETIAQNCILQSYNNSYTGKYKTGIYIDILASQSTASGTDKFTALFANGGGIFLQGGASAFRSNNVFCGVTCAGRVNSSGTLLNSWVITFMGGYLSSSRFAEGRYRIYFSNTGYFSSGAEYQVIILPDGLNDNGAGAYGTVSARYTSYFDVWMADDASPNNTGFTFIVFLLSKFW